MVVEHAVVLAGGEGSRLAAITGDRPKSLVEIHGKPLLFLKLAELKRNGVKAVTLLLGKGSIDILAALDDCPVEIDVTHLMDPYPKIGTGGALVAALPALPQEFFLTYGDTLLDVRYQDLVDAAQNAGTPAAMVVTTPLKDIDVANCLYEDERVVSHSKKRLMKYNSIDYGLLCFSRTSIESSQVLAKTPLDLSELVGEICEKGDMAGLFTDSAYWEAGTPRSLQRVRREFERRAIQFGSVFE